MVQKKRLSKRVTLKDQYKIKKRAAEKHRKQRRTAKKALNGGKKKSKDPGIPNLLPYKEKFINELQKTRQTEINRQNRLQKLQLAKKFATPEPETEEIDEDGSDNEDGAPQKSKAYLKELYQVMNISDILLYILDARDPISCLSGLDYLSLEGKKLILILNKIDLVSQAATEAWMTYLRNEQKLPVIAFRASAQNQKSNLARLKTDNLGLTDPSRNSKVCIGGDTLLELIKNYSRIGGSQQKGSVTVGVVGYPNVGKSSVINSLKRGKAVGVSSVAGYTKGLSTVKIDSKVKIVDSPGVVFVEEKSSLINVFCTNVEKEQDCVALVGTVFDRLLKKPKMKEDLLIKYRLEDFDTKEKFLCNMARARGKLLKGGIADMEAAAKIFIKDIQNGDVDCAMPPPDIDDGEMSVESS